MVKVLLVSPDWQRAVEVDAADEVIEAEGMSWEREGTHRGDAVAVESDDAGDLPRYVPAVSA